MTDLPLIPLYTSAFHAADNVAGALFEIEVGRIAKNAVDVVADGKFVAGVKKCRNVSCLGLCNTRSPWLAKCVTTVVPKQVLEHRRAHPTARAAMERDLAW